MSIRIPLPSVSRQSNSRAHPFPFRIGLQAQEFIQGTLFHAIVTDMTTGEYVRQTDGLEKLKLKMINEGLQADEWESGWKYLGKYQPIFENWVFQNVLISMRGHWDWYVRKLGEFVVFARGHVPCTALTKVEERSLQQIGFKEITQQLDILEKACDLKFALSSDVLSSLKEMALVRNLGLHNRWEVDSFYIQQSSSTRWAIGDVRIIDKTELREWHNSLKTAINEISVQIATKFYQVSDYS